MVFHLPSLLTAEEQQPIRLLPKSGDLVALKFYDRVPGKISSFRLYACFGICVASKNNGPLSWFLIRNSFQKNSLELRFFLYSPLLLKAQIFSSKRKRYNQAKIFYLRKKKIAASRIRF
jgi:ribosomal protein L19